MTEHEVMRQVCEKHGKNQLYKVFEELGEVIAALGKYAFTGAHKCHVAEEIADAQIVLEELILMLECQEEVNAWRSRKILRTKERELNG